MVTEIGKLVVIQDILRPAFFVPESKLAVELLKAGEKRSFISTHALQP